MVKQEIPSVMRNNVCNEYIGIDKSNDKCFCCNIEPITKVNFECGHIVYGEREDEVNIKDLYPVCSACDKLVGAINNFNLENPDLNPNSIHSILAKRLLNIMNKNRVKEHVNCIMIGSALHSVDKTLLSDYIEFLKSSKSCDLDFYKSMWKDFKNFDHSLTIAALYYWAKEDDSTKYEQLMREFSFLLIDRFNFDYSPYDIANIVFLLYRHSFKCTSISKNTWYEYKNHKWKFDESCCALYKKFSDELPKYFIFSSNIYNKKSKTCEYDKINFFSQKEKLVNEIIEKFNNINFKKQIMIACAHKFYEMSCSFQEKLDSNPNLIGFENGIYDLELGMFRNGMPDDNVSMSTGYEYKEYNYNDKEIKFMEEYFDKIMIEQDMRNYLCRYLSSCLNGHLYDQKYILWSGNNLKAKQMTIKILEQSLGEYFGTLPSSILTRKRDVSCPPEFANKKGKRVLFIDTTDCSETIYLGVLKNLVNGDYMESKLLYGNPFRYKPQFKIITLCTEIPYIPTKDRNTITRLRITPWESIQNSDKVTETINDNISDYKQVFIWLLLNKYYPDFVKNGLEEPVKLLIAQYKKDEGLMEGYFDKTFIVTSCPKDKVHAEQFYEGFKIYCMELNKNIHIPSRSELEEYVKNNYNGYFGIKILNDEIIGIIVKDIDSEDDDF